MKRFFPVAIAVLLFLGTAPVHAHGVHIEEVIKNPTVTCKTAFGVDVSAQIWDGLLDNPCLMGRLWEVYGFQPRYQVARSDTGFHVSDPSGITGEIRQVGQSDHVRTFYATGRFDHWAVPSFFTAKGVAILAYTRDRDRLAGEATIFLRGDNGISRFVMRIFSGILTRRINKRLYSTLENIQTIIRDIAGEPHTVRDVLTGRWLTDFDRVFSVPGVRPTKDREVHSELPSQMYR